MAQGTLISPGEQIARFAPFTGSLLVLAPADFQEGLNVAHYVLLRRIGVGGTSTVWAAMDARTQTPVALKLLKRDFDQELVPNARIRLRREAHATRSVAHPAIVPVLDVLDCDGSPVLVMELLNGETLRDRLRREEKLSLADVARLLLPVVDALRHAHAAGIIHRDLKPENVFIQQASETERVRLLDFGVARFYEPPPGSDGTTLTDLDTVIGTAAYMAPEQVLHPTEVDHRIDIWAIGVILYEVLSGCRPVEGVSNRDTLRQLLVGCITPIQVLCPELPGEVVQLINAMLSRTLGKRPKSLDEVGELLSMYRAP